MYNYVMNAIKNERTTKVKKYIDSKHVYLVSVYLDKDYKYSTFDEIPNDAEVVVHEFPEYFLSLEYTRILEEMNKDFIGKFLFKCFTLPIEYSENFTNNVTAKTIAEEYFTNPLNKFHHN
jgi:hypothetical protein